MSQHKAESSMPKRQRFTRSTREHKHRTDTRPRQEPVSSMAGRVCASMRKHINCPHLAKVRPRFTRRSHVSESAEAPDRANTEAALEERPAAALVRFRPLRQFRVRSLLPHRFGGRRRVHGNRHNATVQNTPVGNNQLNTRRRS
jgi:hypothetical protein